MNNQDYIYLSRGLSVEQLKDLRKRAKAYLPERVEMFAARYGFEYNSVALKNNKTNWGSCSNKLNINLNIMLMLLPTDFADYVILHELCHLKHLNHSAKFHDLLESLCVEHFGAIRSTTRSRYPVSRTIELELKKYRIR